MKLKVDNFYINILRWSQTIAKAYSVNYEDAKKITRFIVSEVLKITNDVDGKPSILVESKDFPINPSYLETLKAIGEKYNVNLHDAKNIYDDFMKRINEGDKSDE